jgi:hypothetical protein
MILNNQKVTLLPVIVVGMLGACLGCENTAGPDDSQLQLSSDVRL